MGWLTNVIIENKAVENERLELTDKDSLYFLGPNLTLHNCTVVLKVPARHVTVALTKYAPAVAKKLETTPEELRAVIERFDCFVY
ncbi:hypothetical protein KYC5002_16190 [Archangium violaceum]|uniref:hypothetical protein n=1 Tax=Archangium violaceum TaxID=83451 RepID=UPI002B283A79|nr:hypothetical protein KYC5002_16190 [Archangium gephyra]